MITTQSYPQDQLLNHGYEAIATSQHQDNLNKLVRALLLLYRPEMALDHLQDKETRGTPLARRSAQSYCKRGLLGTEIQYSKLRTALSEDSHHLGVLLSQIHSLRHNTATKIVS